MQKERHVQRQIELLMIMPGKEIGHGKLEAQLPVPAAEAKLQIREKEKKLWVERGI